MLEHAVHDGEWAVKDGARMLAVTWALGLLVSGVPALAQAANSPIAWPTAVIESGPVRGMEQGYLISYRGIPYATAPVGRLRWRPPQRPKSWSSVRDATEFGSQCPQNRDLGVFAAAGGSEDCLFLNVSVNKIAAASNDHLPVFVWIHGGGLFAGSGNDYDVSKLALVGRAVVVTFNYRLGVLGVLAEPGLDREGHPFANYGMMDQSFAFDWVKRNIAAFGGDPNNITIAGESSGGDSVLAHVASPWSSGKFQHAVAMSGSTLIVKYPISGAPVPFDKAERRGAEFARSVGCLVRTPACLRAIPVDKILSTQTQYLTNQVVIDGQVMPILPADAFRTGRYNQVTLINGTTLNEGTFFTGLPENETGRVMSEDGYVAAMKSFFADQATAVMIQYPIADYITPSEAYSAALGDFWHACPADAVNRWLSNKIPVYAYEFLDRTAPSYLKPTSFVLGAAHTFELSYIFPGFHGAVGRPVALNTQQNTLSDAMVRYWTGSAGAAFWEAEWPRFSNSDGNYLTFVLPHPKRSANAFRIRHKCDFWDKTGLY
jgi:para-nitrobenzyl esterase